MAGTNISGARSEASAEGTRAPTILVVEDEENIAASLQFSLEREGYRVVAAAEGGQALELFAREHPDLILLDLMLPGMSGLDICRIIREDASVRQPGIIMLTAKSSDIDAVVGLDT